MQAEKTDGVVLASSASGVGTDLTGVWVVSNGLQLLQDLLRVGFLAEGLQCFWKCRMATQSWYQRRSKPGSKLLVIHQQGLRCLLEVLQLFH